MLNTKLVYTSTGYKRLTPGKIYNVVRCNEYTITILDNNNNNFTISNNVLHLWFKDLSKWREEQIDKLCLL
jgi:hypothetical protein